MKLPKEKVQEEKEKGARTEVWGTPIGKTGKETEECQTGGRRTSRVWYHENPYRTQYPAGKGDQ